MKIKKYRNINSMFLLFGVCLLSSTFSFAQLQRKVDSISKLILETKVDTIKMELYGKISWQYINSSQLEQAKSYADSLRIYSEKLNDSSGIAYSQFYYGTIARYTGQYSDALDHLQTFVGHYSTVGDSIKVSHGLFQMGSVYQNIGNYEKAVELLYRALKIHEQKKDQSSINEALNNIAIVLKKAKQYDESQRMFERVLLTDSLNTDVLMNLGNLYGEKGELETAEKYYLKALKIDEESGNERFVAFDLENLGNLYIKKKAYDKALSYGMRALRIREGLPYKIDNIYSLKQMGIIYLKKNDHATAKNYLVEAEKVARSINAKFQLKDIYKNSAQVHFKEQNYLKAFEHQKNFSDLNDSLLNKETQRLINGIKIKYETQKKDQQIALLAKEKQLQEKEIQKESTIKKAFIGGFILIFLLGTSIIYNNRQKLKNQRLLSEKDKKINEVHFKQKVSELEMKALRAQINPHFLFNCMNSINLMILENNNENASKYLAKFSKLIRLILENAEHPTVSLKKETELLESYIQLEKLRFKGKINYHIAIDETIDADDTYLPSMILQPFVENAILHGIMHKEKDEAGVVKILIKEDKNAMLYCIIEDNGVGREKAAQLLDKSVLKSKSMGMKITEDRLRLLSKKGWEKLVSIVDLKDTVNKALGTRVEINIPIIN